MLVSRLRIRNRDGCAWVIVACACRRAVGDGVSGRHLHPAAFARLLVESAPSSADGPEIPLIYNPRSGGGKGTTRMQMARTLLAERGVATRPVATEGPGGARPLAIRLVGEGATRILVVGGDGTLSEAADGVLSTGKRTALGLLPGGTGNSFLRDFGLEALPAAVERAATARPRAFDAAIARSSAGERHFINVFATGFAAKVCDYANRRLKWMGHSSYTWAVFPELARLKSPATRLVLDGKEIDRRFALITVCNTMHTGGAMKIAPMAKPDDGLLEIVALEHVSRAMLLRLFSMIFKGKHVGQESVFLSQAKRVEIVPEEPSPLLADGEVYGRTPVAIECLPGALSLLL